MRGRRLMGERLDLRLSLFDWICQRRGVVVAAPLIVRYDTSRSFFCLLSPKPQIGGTFVKRMRLFVVKLPDMHAKVQY